MDATEVYQVYKDVERMIENNTLTQGVVLNSFEKLVEVPIMLSFTKLAEASIITLMCVSSVLSERFDVVDLGVTNQGLWVKINPKSNLSEDITTGNDKLKMTGEIQGKLN